MGFRGALAAAPEPLRTRPRAAANRPRHPRRPAQAPSAMEISLNGTPRQVQEALSLRQLLESLKLPTLDAGVAVSVNGELVRKQDWPGRPLHARDEVEVVQATQGG